MNAINEPYEVTALFAMLGSNCSTVSEDGGDAAAPVIENGSCIASDGGVPTTCGAVGGAGQRACCCSASPDNCPVPEAQEGWRRAVAGESCSDLCSFTGLSLARHEEVNTARSIRLLASDVGQACLTTRQATPSEAGLAPYVNGTSCVFARTGLRADAFDADANAERVCCCGSASSCSTYYSTSTSTSSSSSTSS